MKKVIIVLLLVLCWANVFAQDNCYFPTRKGVELIYKYYNHRGKPLKDQWGDKRWIRFEVEDVWTNDSGMVINVSIGNETIDRFASNERTQSIAEYLSYGDVKVEGGRVTLDNMQWLANVIPSTFSPIFNGRNQNEGCKFRAEISALSSFPCRMEVGDTLPDEKILDMIYYEILTEEEIARREAQIKELEAEIMAVSGQGLGSIDYNAHLKVKASTRDRKVEAFEKVTTPAGTFDCYKISYELLLPLEYNFTLGVNVVVIDGVVQPIRIRYADWISPEVGLVKREKYNDSGKVQEYMQLESYK